MTWLLYLVISYTYEGLLWTKVKHQCENVSVTVLFRLI